MNEIDKLEGDALNRAVAEALGWRVRHQDIGMGGWRWENDLGQGRGQTYKTQELCEQMWFEGIPDYAADINAAWALLPDYAVITKTPYDGTIQIKYELGNRVIATASHPATAICRAFLHDQEQAAQADDRRQRQDDYLDNLAASVIPGLINRIEGLAQDCQSFDAILQRHSKRLSDLETKADDRYDERRANWRQGDAL